MSRDEVDVVSRVWSPFVSVSGSPAGPTIDDDDIAFPPRGLALDAEQPSKDIENEVVAQARRERPEHPYTEASGFMRNSELCERPSLIRRELHLDSLVV
jgi:hypothetical protein